MAEFQVHGSKLEKEILSVLEQFDRLQINDEPGEFTKLAFQNNKINLLKANKLSLIAAERKQQKQV